MSNIEIEKVLAQMSAMSLKATNGSSEQSSKTEFSDLLKQSIDKVNETQMQAGQLKKAFETGETDTNLSEVMVSIQKASITFEAMVQVRNKLVRAYEDVMNMPM